MTEYLIGAYETWDGSRGNYKHKHIFAKSQFEAETEGLEFAFSLLEPYMNEIKHYAEYMAEHGYDYDDTIHNTMLECAHYELWVKA